MKNNKTNLAAVVGALSVPRRDTAVASLFRGTMTDFIDAKEAANILKVNVRTIRRRARSGQIKAIRVGTLWRFKREDIERGTN